MSVQSSLNDTINQGLSFFRPKDTAGNYHKISDYFGENTFDIQTAEEIPDSIREEINEVINSNAQITESQAQIVAKAVTAWALNKGATHFCHWFQPLTGATAEKHDAFLDYDYSTGQPIEELSATQLIQGEPDASSFPNGGARSTFEARGYTAWDLTSPMFLIGSGQSKTLCIPTAFVSYHGEALDIKTPLLRSNSALGEVAKKFLHLTGETDVKRVIATCGAEQEYFLIDKAYYYQRRDLVMTGRTLFGAASTKNQQLDDHYFGAINERVMAFMEELDFELHKLGIPAKTRHNEVAPGQFEIAQIFRDANISADNNHMVMATIENVAKRHDFEALMHEKPFAGINGSGKHLNWSLASDTGINLLNPGKEPHQNYRFLAFTAAVITAVDRHAKLLRASIASHSNDHRLGANEAPPSIISVFTGSTIEKIFKAIKEKSDFAPESQEILDLGAGQLAKLPKDNTDRNRTSPFAFTGNKFEFRACGSDQSIGFPLTILNGAVTSVLEEVNHKLESKINEGTPVDQALLDVCHELLNESWNVIFNGDGYSQEWLEEAERRGLPNLKTTADCLEYLVNKDETSFLTKHGIYRNSELETLYNVHLEAYITKREIEFNTLIGMVNQHVIPAAIQYKEKLTNSILASKSCKVEATVEKELLKELQFSLEGAFEQTRNLKNALSDLHEKNSEEEAARKIAYDLMPVSELIAQNCANLEQIIPDDMWPVPTYFEMLFCI
ncbi:MULTISPECIES: glutamine synthetase III [unclassified Halobacteriovorax]|uniref:glutamine synthetase III family protein n=1 Tax=unclassified Halobacteriovorax TaxID=2639665 RepID=UPI000EB6EFE3|nr:glutamine synthetase III [Halobacteriovorax sp. BALOs_7]AYF44810.1 glutamine synthetase type III N-terminal [Halobacteriovorax sp. BALOs_7]